MALVAAPPGVEPGIMPALDPRCHRREVTNGVTVIVYLGDRACVDFSPPRVFEGLWVNAFEGSRFVEGARRIDELPRGGENVWLSIDDQSRMPPGIRPGRHPTEVFRVRFRGRGARDMHRRPLEGYGHFNMSAGLVLVDEMLSMERVGELPRR